MPTVPHPDTGTIAGIALWALALYLAFSPLTQRLITWLEQSLGEGSPAASLLSLGPFLVIGGLTHWALSLSLGGSWSVSWGVIAAIGSGVYELGRQAGQTPD